MINKETILITGALSNISLEIINRTIDKSDKDLILCEHPVNEKRLLGLKNKIEEHSDAKVTTLLFDALSVKEIRKNIEEIDKGIDIFYNLIGRNVFKGIFEVDEDDWDKVLDTNLKSAFFLSQAVSLNMKTYQKSGSIVKISSQHGIVANGMRAPYCVSKAGIIHLTKVLALELSPYKIRANCVSPTYIYDNKSKDFLSNHNVEKEYLPKIPLKRYARPSDVASACIFLADKKNALITGSNIIVDGGYTIW